MSHSMPSSVMFGSIEVPTKTEIGKELWSHERKPDYDPAKNVYPRMMYKAYKGEDGRVRCMDSEPQSYEHATQEMYRMALAKWEVFTKSCQLTVLDEQGELSAKSNGWRNTPKEASDAVFAWEKEMAHVATETAHANRNMSPAAKAEFQEAEDATPHILPEMPEKRTVKLHWKTKQKMERDALKDSSG